jgi:hypothetical protein
MAAKIRLPAIEGVQQVANARRAPNILALPLGQAKLAALNHHHEFFDSCLSLRRRIIL